MSFLKTLWGVLFRLFPCPTEIGLRPVGQPGRDSPVLVTCNFDLTAKRVARILRRAGVDAWLVVADSKGVNVWCAAGGDEFCTRTVVSAVKTSGVADRVDHRTLILPPLGAPGVYAADVREQTGWKKVRWGPIRAEDLPRYLANDARREAAMKRATYSLGERLDTALGSMFPLFLLGALGVAFFGVPLLLQYLIIGVVAFLCFFTACPWLPGRTGFAKVLFLELLLGAALAAGYLLWPAFPHASSVIMAMILFALFGTELGGLSSTMKSDADPFMARLGIGAIGNVKLAGSVRTDLLNGYRVLVHDRETCNGCGQCHEVCPVGVWEKSDASPKPTLSRVDDCVACRACLTQCPTGAAHAPSTRD